MFGYSYHQDKADLLFRSKAGRFIGKSGTNPFFRPDPPRFGFRSISRELARPKLGQPSRALTCPAASGLRRCLSPRRRSFGLWLRSGPRGNLLGRLRPGRPHCRWNPEKRRPVRRSIGQPNRHFQNQQCSRIRGFIEKKHSDKALRFDEGRSEWLLAHDFPRVRRSSPKPPGIAPGKFSTTDSPTRRTWGDENNVIWRVCFSARICSGFGATLKSSFFPYRPVLKRRAIPAQGDRPWGSGTFMQPSPEGARHNLPSFDTIICHAPSGLGASRRDEIPGLTTRAWLW